MTRPCRPLILLCFFALICLARTGIAHAQLNLPNLPSWTSNARFATPAVAQVKHPSLSFNGFDCGSSCGIGLGLKQVLDKVVTLDPLVRPIFDNLVDLYNDPVVTNSPNYG